MTTDRLIAILMMYFQVAMIMLLRESYGYSGLIALLMTLYVVARGWRVNVTPKYILYISMVLSLLFYWKNIVISSGPDMNIYDQREMGLMLAEYVLAIQFLMLFWKRPDGKVTIVFPLGSCVVLTLLGTARITNNEYEIYQTMVLAFVLLCASFYSARRTRRDGVKKVKRQWGFEIVLLGLVMVSAVGLARMVYVYQNDLDAAFNKLTPSFNPISGVRLNPETQLGSVADMKTSNREAVALRIYSAAPPGYLRAYTFNEYEPPFWRNTMEWSHTEGERVRDGVYRKRFALPMLSEQQEFSNTLIVREIWPHKEIGAVAYSQLQMPFIEGDVHSYSLGDMGDIVGTRIYKGAPYRTYIDPDVPVPAPSEEMEAALLALPSELDPRIRELAKTIMKGAETDEQKIYRVITYFLSSYEYKMGITIPEDVDPLTYFLLEQPAAHCEYFASGAAILLRLGGVPSRYVTGYVSHEKNSVSEYYVARSRDAHAWVEAWDAENGWMIVEATPSEGVPQEKTSSEFSDWLDSLKQQWNKFKEAIASQRYMRSLRETVLSLASMARMFFSSPEFITVVLIVLVILGVRRYRRYRESLYTFSYGRHDYHELLNKMDRWVESLGFVREEQETVLQFAGRIRAEEQEGMRAIGDWYGTYSALRYDPAAQPELGMRSLGEQLKALVESGIYSSIRSKTM